MSALEAPRKLQLKLRCYGRAFFSWCDGVSWPADQARKKASDDAGAVFVAAVWRIAGRLVLFKRVRMQAYHRRWRK